MRKLLILGVAICYSSFLLAQIPAGYYDSANWKEGEELRLALYNIIKGHTVRDYDALWSYFQQTDKKSNGQVWDMYSDNPGGTPPYTYSYSIAADQCGNYNNEGDCYNREHSFPKSWFNDASPMESDLFHVYPTDGDVNGKRSNNPFGTVGNASWTSQNGSKLGSSNVSGYSGTVFEPIDEYKGDFARSYFYMITRYQNVAAGWSSEMLQGNTFSDWALKMLYFWDKNDPVSQKEIDRNNAVYAIQKNRNPFIDHPEYVYRIWDGPVGIEEQTKITISYKINNKSLVTEQNGDVKIFDVSGKVLVSERNTNRLDFSNLNPGVYFIQLQCKENFETVKFAVTN